ncbi:MAG: DUF1844 domain-containing protein [Verrucomicrobiota bacterium]
MNESKPDINKVLFMHLVSMLAMSAIQQMGKLVDPATGKAATNLDAAQATIDMLDMLLAKTKNNLDAEEEKLMKDTLSSLKINFVETKDAEERKTDDRRSGTAGTDNRPEKAGDGIEKQTSNAEGRKTEDGMPEPKSDKTPPKDPKFHKNYA